MVSAVMGVAGCDRPDGKSVRSLLDNADTAPATVSEQGDISGPDRPATTADKREGDVGRALSPRESGDRPTAIVTISRWAKFGQHSTSSVFSRLPQCQLIRLVHRPHGLCRGDSRVQSIYLRAPWLIAIVSLVFFAPSVAADRDVPAELSPVITTATRIPQNLAYATAPVLVISRADIVRSQAGDVAQLLRFYAGIDLGRNGGPGQNTGVFLRGSESNHTLVLVDGVEINPGTLGGAAVYNIRPDMIERIEIVKGPRSALWGSEAIGGVLNIITRSAEDGLAWSASAGAGRFDTRSASFESRMRGARGGLIFGFSNIDSDGFPTRRDSDIDRAHDNTSINLKADTTIGSAEFATRYWEARGNTEYLDFFLAPVEQDFVNSVLAGDINLKLARRWQSKLTLSQTRDEILQLNNDDYVNTDRIMVDWHNTLLPVAGHTLLAGASVSEERTESLSFGAFFKDSTQMREVYVSDYVELAAHRLLLSARHSEHETFGSAFTWNIEPAFQLAEDIRLTLGLGTSYRAPDGTDRFGFGGNPDLRPERGRNAEIGLQFDLNNARLAASIYQNDIDDLVEFVFDPLTFAGGNINVGRARIRGIDMNYELVAQNWRWRIGAVLQDPENLSEQTTLARRARRSLSTSLARELSWGELGFDVLASGSRRDSPFSNIVNAGFVLANVTARIDLSERLALRMCLENLLNSDYETAAGFNSAGRGLQFSLSYTSP